jgi:hypothetical protein
MGVRMWRRGERASIGFSFGDPLVPLENGVGEGSIKG